MRTHIKSLFLAPALIASLGLIPAGRVTAQTFATLHSFTSLKEGATWASLILSGNTLYGTAEGGKLSSTYSNGTVFAVNTDGTGFTNLHRFSAVNGSTNSDGASPEAGLILSGNILYGTAAYGGGSGRGTVFAVNTDGTGFTNLHSFTATSGPLLTNSDGAGPEAGLILSGNTLYGTANGGGSSGKGTVFAVNTDGSGFTTLYSFTAASYPNYTNSDGAYPRGGLILANSTLYGTAERGGSSGNGTVFAVNTNGTGFTNLHSFAALNYDPSSVANTNRDGAYPYGLILSGNTLYGTAGGGGGAGNGTVFKVNNDRTGFTNLHTFTAFNSSTNSDGANPYDRLVLSGNTLYGTAVYGGGAGNGTVFAVNTDGSGFTTLHSFTANPFPLYTNSDGAMPYAGLLLSGNTLYGTAYAGGSYNGTVFSISLGSVIAPQLTIVPSGGNVILTWPANPAGFTLQSAPAVTGTFTNLPGATSPYTNAANSSQQFFRLHAN